MTNQWIVVGSSPSVIDTIDDALNSIPEAQIITCNAGASLFFDRGTRPDYLFMYDKPAIDAWHADINKVHSMGGTIVTTKASQGWMRKYIPDGAPRYDVIEVGKRRVVCPKYDPNRAQHPRFSGLFCLQYALHHGADRVALVGMDGYRSSAGSHVVDDFDGRMGRDIGVKTTQRWIKPFVESCILGAPAVQFAIYGNPNYELPNARNLQRVLPKACVG